jgi:formate hydrogenlyase subunit 6/NADH:ubiquinone oxidoreductase subunit I
MTFHILPKSALDSWVQHLLAGRRVFAPVRYDGSHRFAEIETPEQVDLTYRTTILPPKKALLPPRETLLHFDTREGELRTTAPPGPAVILGVHTCDLHAMQLLDKVFGQGFTDQGYQSRRANTILVGLECLAPCSEHSFCKSMGTLTCPEQFDLHLTDLGESYALDVGSERGESLLRGFDGLRPPRPADYRLADQVMNDKWSRFPYRLEFDAAELPSLMGVSGQSPVWEQLAERCLACGSCNLVCPTCTCFDVADQVDLALRSGERYRTWDSCQLAMFATVAGGHNFRAAQAARLRHRFMRKGKYQFEATGFPGCVGCGRCAQACLVHITPVDTWNELRRAQPHPAQEATA